MRWLCITARNEDAVFMAISGFGEDKAIGVIKAEEIDGERTDR